MPEFTVNGAISKLEISPKTTSLKTNDVYKILYWLADNTSALRQTTMPVLSKQPFNIGVSQQRIYGLFKNYFRPNNILMCDPTKECSRRTPRNYYINYWSPLVPTELLDRADPTDIAKARYIAGLFSKQIVKVTENAPKRLKNNIQQSDKPSSQTVNLEIPKTDTPTTISFTINITVK